MNKVVIFSAPSGSGKTTIVKYLLGRLPMLEFSISATSRAPRGEERHGVDYFFFTAEEFSSAVDRDLFVEHEEVYAGTSYGTLRSEVERIWAKGGVVVFDVDVVGGVNLKRVFGSDALSIFIMPPSVAVLRERLEGRGTDSMEAIDRRLSKAVEELSYADRFDLVVVNDDLVEAELLAESAVRSFIVGVTDPLILVE